MFDLDRWQEIWITITRNKTRSILTAFGVFWGIFMLIVMSGAGYGLQKGIMEGTKGIPPKSAFFFSNLTTEAYKGFKKGRYWNLRTHDKEILRHRMPEIKYIGGMLFGWKQDNNTFYNDKYGTYYVKGVEPDIVRILPQQLLRGRYVNQIDVAEKRKVCVIGKKVYEELFLPGENPEGKMIRVNGQPYRVIGVCNPTTGATINGDDKEAVILPISTMQQNEQRGETLDMLAIALHESADMDNTEKKITELIKSQNMISPTDPQAVSVFNLEKQFRIFRYLFLGIQALIWIVGTGTLIAGIVGVSNIMLVTVKERTREIGIRRALGAKPRTILSQILSESLTLTSLAGFLGLGAGVGLLQIISLGMPQENNSSFFSAPQIPFDIAVIASVILLISGLMAGILPVWRALQIKPIDAIREE